MSRRISILGSTGSIGRQSLEVIAACGMTVGALTANASVDRLEEQARRFRPELAVMMDERAAADLKVRLADTPTKVASGMEGFIEAELADRRVYQALAQRAPASARRTMRDLANASGAAAKRLLTARYLITGACYRPAVARGRIPFGDWCSTLRERYHVEACNGMNYLRAGEETTDPCLGRLLKALGEESYRQADQLMALLERAL